MKSHLILLALATCAATALAQPALPTPVEGAFESGAPVRSSDFIAPALMKGRLHSVRALADNDGMLNTYVVDTTEGGFEVTGTTALAVRIRELYAIDYLRGVSKSEEFGKAIAESGKAVVKSVGGVVRDPVGTIKNVPKGASRFFGRVTEGLKGPKSEVEGGSISEITGVNKAKVQLAAQLGVSPYTTNEELQHELFGVARAMAGGGLVVKAATAAVGGAAGNVVSVLGVNQTLQDTLINNSPEDLRSMNRKKLLALSVDPALAEDFLMHPWYSPWHETITTDALATIGVDPSAFLSDAVRALTPEDALFFQRVAQILSRYHSTTAPLRAIRFEGGIITALDRNGTLVVPVSFDYGIWAEHTARRVGEFSSIDKSRDGIKGLALWTDGRLSERLCTELKTRGISYRADALINQ